MKRRCVFGVLLLLLVFALPGCAAKEGNPSGHDPLPGGQEPQGTEIAARDPEEIVWDRIPMVRINGKLYYDTGEESGNSVRCGMADGEITSAVDGTEIPAEDGQSNFGAGFRYQYGSGDTVEVFLHEKWIVFEHREGTGGQVRFGDKLIDADGLSEETLDWLGWYNSLPEEERQKVSAIPTGLLEDAQPTDTEDADGAAK